MYLEEMSVSPTQTCLHNHISFILWNGLATKKKLDTKAVKIVTRTPSEYLPEKNWLYHPSIMSEICFSDATGSIY